MKHSQENRQQHLRREKILFRYTNAFERRDFDTLTNLWHEVEQDPFLVQQILEMHQAYEQEELQESIHNRIQHALQLTDNSRQIDKVDTAVLVNEEPGSMDRLRTYTGNKSNPSRHARKHSRTWNVLQALAAVLILGILIGSFTLFINLHKSTITAKIPKNITNSTKIVITVGTNGIIHALHANNGKEIWHYTIEPSSIVQEVSIVINNGFVFCNFTGHIYTLNLESGMLLWQQTLPVNAVQAQSHPARPNIFVNNNIILTNASDSYYYAIRASDGTILWHTIKNTSSVIALSNGIALLEEKTTDLDFIVQAMNAKNGSVIWKRAFNTDSLDAVLAGSTLYVTTFAPKSVSESVTSQPPLNATMHKLLATKTTPIATATLSESTSLSPSSGPTVVILTALNIQDGRTIWEYNREQMGFYSPVQIVKDTVLAIYSISYGTTQICGYSINSGREQWCQILNFVVFRITGDNENNIFYVSPQLAETPTGEHKIGIEAYKSSDGTFLGSQSLDTTSTSYTLNLFSGHDALFVDTSDHLYALNKQNGHILWSTTSINNQNIAYMAVAD